ncbi:amino acid ABC transporter ATP-binding protein [Actinomycetospora sp. OC33-EN08]|uniref:Amino acid ABC transporter ATP-binding protein n=1 Tax=Actinomycetospora aurantiaca TaxID=3129233 RepID=A0ABU8MID6_9PSEU
MTAGETQRDAARHVDVDVLPAAGVEVHGAYKAFGALTVLDGVDLTVAPGTVTVILGPSGSGKSTLLRAINHLEPLDRGYVSIDGDPIGVRRVGDRLKERPEREILVQRRRIGFVFQDFNLFPHLTAVENVAAAPVATGAATRTRALGLARDLLARVGLADKADVHPRRLSGGQQQRVAIARALALRPSVILCDEPTSALDPELVDDVLEVIEDLASTGTTLIVVTHEIGFAREVADQVVFLDGGVVVEQGPPSQVLDHPVHPRTREFVGRVL